MQKERPIFFVSWSFDFVEITTNIKKKINEENIYEIIVNTKEEKVKQ